ncbi:MAG: ABC transporter substrate-binding protein [Candidatus Sumerlaeaceae bacterium]|nr:ABC transporter substrate-binding protein [Candidatus Sumerlaeaceae bacterium]
MSWLKRLIRFAAAFAAAGLLGGCARPGGDDTRASATEKVFNAVMVAEPKRLDPAFCYDLYEGIVSGLIHEGLVFFGRENEILPGLAERWEISPDGRSYTFALREAFFSDGRPVTSADVRYSFTRILRPATNSERKWLFDSVEGADEVASGTATDLRGLETPDPRTVIIRLKRPDAAFLTKLAMPNAAIIPEDSAGRTAPDRAYDTAPVGAGPWRLDKWLRDRRLEFRRNEHHWGGRFPLDRLLMHIQTDDRVMQQGFEAGNLDIHTVSFTAWPQWSADPARRERMMPVQELNTYYIGIMCSKPHLADRRVRQAIAHAIDADGIFENLQRGRGIRAAGPVVPGVPGYRQHLSPRRQDIARARALLAEAGAQGLNLDFWFTQENLTAEIVAAARAGLEEAGFKVNLVRRDNPSLRQAIYNGEPDLYFWSWWLDYPDIENALEPTFHSRNIPFGGNGARYSNPEADALMDAARAESDPDRRIALYQQVEDIVRDDCPWVFLYHRRSYVMVQPWVTGYKPAIMYNADRFTEVDVDLAKKRH